ncbi:MAG TPA: small multi-drug export protein [Patescibacteria group bacterium]|nr:small multi-drug export protein [Patescibacteria group bacterium]
MLENNLLKVFISAMLPITELRGALPLALLHYRIDIVTAYFITVIGNMIPVIFIVFLLDPVQKFLSSRSRLFRWFFQKLFERTRSKHTKRFETMEEIALITFVAIPLPMTGGWSGALAAFVFGISPKKSIPLIFLGVAIAGVIVSILTLGVRFIITG